jgi:hypothetical protein
MMYSLYKQPFQSFSESNLISNFNSRNYQTVLYTMVPSEPGSEVETMLSKIYSPLGFKKRYNFILCESKANWIFLVSGN